MAKIGRNLGLIPSTIKMPMAREVKPMMVMVGRVKTPMNETRRAMILGSVVPGNCRPQTPNGFRSRGLRL